MPRYGFGGARWCQGEILVRSVLHSDMDSTEQEGVRVGSDRTESAIIAVQ
jgi:hypothetical protein